MAYLDENGLAYFKGKLDQITDKLNDQITETDTALDNLTSLIERDTASGSIVEVDAEYAAPVEKLVVNIEPQQDLHGYENPWPEGGGSNIYPDCAISGTISGVTVTQNGSVYTLNGTASAYTQFISNDVLTLAAGTYYFEQFNNATGVYAQLRSEDGTTVYADNSHSFTLDSETRIKARIVVSANTSTNRNLSLMLVNGSTQPSTFSPYSNICPISGWTGAEVTRTGKNLFDVDAVHSGVASTPNTTRNGVEYTKPGTYTIKANVSSGKTSDYIAAKVRHSDGTFDSVMYIVMGGVAQEKQTATISNGDVLVLYDINDSSLEFSIVSLGRADVQVELGSTATDYEPYTGSQISVTFPSSAGTVYGGTLDVTTGELVVDKKKVYITSSTSKSWSTSLGGKGLFTVTLSDAKIDGNPSEQLLSNVFTAHNGRGGFGDVDYQMITYSDPADDKYIRFVVPFSSLEETNEWLDAVSVEVVYPLATPITYTLTESEVSSVLSTIRGTNYIWANTGDITELKYQSGGFATTNTAAQMIEKSAGTKADVITETASGSIVSFSDGADGLPVKSLTVNIEPQQDLHGYDNPWPAGGGKNKLYVSSATKTANGVTYTVNSDGSITANGRASDNTIGSSFWITNRDNYTLPAGDYVFSGCTGGSYSNSYYMAIDPIGKVNSNGDTTFTISDATQILYPRITINPGVTVNNVVFKPMIRLATEADATYAPYSNICPISGWTGAEIVDTGINIWDEEWDIGNMNDSTGAYISGVYLRSKNKIRIVGGLSYYMAKPYTVVYCYFYDANNNYMPQGSAGYLTLSGNAHVFTAPVGAAYIAFVVNTTYGNVYNRDISINYPATDIAYHPYTGSQISVTFPTSAGDNGTVYGGTLTINPDRTGTLVVDRVFGVIDGNTNIRTGFDTNFCSFYFAALSLPNAVSTSGIESKLISSRFKTTTYSTTNDDRIYQNNEAIFSIRTSSPVSGTEESWHEYFATNNTQISYLIANPQTYQLTATEISAILTTLYGINNIWADAGDVTVEYPVDTKLYIQQLTKPTEDDMTADNAIAAGTFFMIGNTLYLATAQIAAGATITPGTNATKLSLADALNQLNA